MKNQLNDGLIAFLNESHNEYLAANFIRKILSKSGFKEIKENEAWNLKENSKYFFLRNGNSLVAFVTPTGLIKATFITKLFHRI